MEILTSYFTHQGNVKKMNQDSLSVKVINSPKGRLAFALICDGMGGLEQGELASKEVVIAFNNWLVTEFAWMITEDNFSEELLKQQWQTIIETMNDSLGVYANQHGKMMGTTVSAILLYQGRYYICHVGDSRIYKFDTDICQLTEDHTLVAQEVRMGMLTEEEAQKDPRRSVLLQCVGASDIINPQYESGDISGETTFILCSDGFVHMLSKEELKNGFMPGNIQNKEQGNEICEQLVRLAMERGEQDNITVIAIVTK